MKLSQTFLLVVLVISIGSSLVIVISPENDYTRIERNNFVSNKNNNYGSVSSPLLLLTSPDSIQIIEGEWNYGGTILEINFHTFPLPEGLVLEQIEYKLTTNDKWQRVKFNQESYLPNLEAFNVYTVNPDLNIEFESGLIYVEN